MAVTARLAGASEKEDRGLWGMKGAYVLLLEVQGAITVGRLGSLWLEGWYLYVGSALGPGGLSRVRRHFQRDGRTGARPRWHVDVLLDAGALRGAVVAATEDRVECWLARRLRRELGDGVKGLGCSDCWCPSHLLRAPSLRIARGVACGAFRELGLEPVIKRRADLETRSALART